jgi:hypothetical protein
MRWPFIRAAVLAVCLFAVVPSPVPAATAVDSQLFSNISATTSPFVLHGGYYLISGVATWGGGNVELKMLGPDQSTYLSLPTALKLTANGTIAGYLPPGTYEFVVTTSTGVYVSVAGVPIS